MPINNHHKGPVEGGRLIKFLVICYVNVVVVVVIIVIVVVIENDSL